MIEPSGVPEREGLMDWQREEARDVAADVLAKPDTCGRNECYMPAVHQLATFVQGYERLVEQLTRERDEARQEGKLWCAEVARLPNRQAAEAFNRVRAALSHLQEKGK